MKISSPSLVCFAYLYFPKEYFSNSPPFLLPLPVDCSSDWQFQCSDKRLCIDKRRRCDGYDDCYDASDERECQNGMEEQGCLPHETVFNDKYECSKKNFC